MPIGKIATRDRAQASDASLPDLLTSMPLAAALVEQLAAAGRLEEFETQRQCAMLECAAELQTAIDSRQGLREKSLLHQLRSSDVQAVLQRYEEEACELMAARAQAGTSSSAEAVCHTVTQMDGLEETNHTQPMQHPALGSSNVIASVSPLGASRAFAAFLRPPSSNVNVGATGAAGTS